MTVKKSAVVESLLEKRREDMAKEFDQMQFRLNNAIDANNRLDEERKRLIIEVGKLKRYIEEHRGGDSAYVKLLETVIICCNGKDALDRTIEVYRELIANK